MTTVTIDTHGCKLNQADSLVLARHFVEAGYDIIPSNQIADVYVLNSCTVTHVADSKARNAIRVARKMNPKSIIVATGCYAERIGKDISKLVDVDLVVGNTEKQVLVNTVTDLLENPPNNIKTNNIAVKTKYSGNQVTISSRTRAMIKIQEGCNQICAYCIVPKVRGRERSIPPEEIVNNILELERSSYSEVVLTGTQLGTYGFDIQDTDLSTLLNSILENTTIPRIRVSSLQPQEITPALLSIWTDKRMCPHFHIPLQSGSNKILRAMRRRYTTEEFCNTVEMVRKYIPESSITTDVIVGFPGEGFGEFKETYDLCLKTGFANIHTFPFSKRPGTSANLFTNQVNNLSKTSRSKAISEVAKISSTQFRQSLIGQTRPVLWENSANTDNHAVWQGLTDNYVRVRTLDENIVANTISPLLLTSLDAGILTGVLVT